MRKNRKRNSGKKIRAKKRVPPARRAKRRSASRRRAQKMHPVTSKVRARKVATAPSARAVKPALHPNAEIAALKAKWKELAPEEIGKRLKALVASGWKKRRLARALGCSDSVVRKYIDVATAREQAGPSNPSGPMGVKKSVALARKRRASARKERLKVAERDREALRERSKQVLAGWVEKEIPDGWKYQFMAGLSHEQSRCVPSLFQEAAPKPHEIHPETDPAEVIRDCRPKREKPSDIDLINYCLEWYASWAPRVMYDEKLRDEVEAAVTRMVVNR